jgi:hypothetical protein
LPLPVRLESILPFHEIGRGQKAVIDEVSAAAAGREDLYRLARTVYADPRQAMRAAAELGDRHFGPRVTYSRKVFVPLTELCRDNCGYCTFAHPPRPGRRIYPTPEEVLRIARRRGRGVQRGPLHARGQAGEASKPLASEEMRLFEKEVPQSSSVTSLTFLVETPSTYISISAKTSAFSFRW